MINITSAQLDAWIVAFMFPLSRILAFVSTAPLWSTNGIPRRIRLLLGASIAVALAPALPPMPAVPAASLQALWIMAQQMLIGVGMGLAAKTVFTAFEMAGEFIGSQMGLGFATAYDPMSAAQTAVIAEFVSLIALLLFLSMNGHLLFMAALTQSFFAIPISSTPLAAESWRNLAELGSRIFSIGLLLSLPLTGALLVTNIGLGVLARAAPQLNLFALGFPLTMMGGFAALAICMNYLSVPMQGVFQLALQSMLGFAIPGR